MDALNRFAVNPTNVSIPRSKFDRSYSHKTTFDSGKLIPVYLEEALPGDTVSLDTASVLRMSTPIHPVMDNAFGDVYYFAIPLRLLWEHTKEFFGENTTGPWEQTTEYLIPQMRFWNIKPGSLADYFGLPLWEGQAGDTSGAPLVNALPFRAYALIWNEWFRDQSVSPPIPISKGDSTVSIDDNPTNDWFQGPNRPEVNFFWDHCYPLPVGKFHDYFTSALPEPQKGPDVALPLGDLAPLTTTDTMHKLSDDPYEGIKFGTTEDDGVSNGYFVNLLLSNNNLPSNEFRLMNSNAVVSGSQAGAAITHSNLYADLSEAAAATINSFRQALAIQGLYEKDARGGTRYREIIKSHFGVTSLDARQQVPEFLCGKRVPITMSQVLQTSSTDTTSPQGNTAAYSLTQDVGSSFTYSATEHCLIMGVACVRTFQTYSQRIEKLWSRRRRFDFYWPVFANLGEQPIYNRELHYAENSSDLNLDEDPDGVFGFQEAWAEYRYKPNMLTGLFRPNAPTSLDVWHYGEEFQSTPTLSPAFIYQNKEVVSRTLAAENEPQFLADFRFKQTWVRPMPMYSIPALLGRM